MVHEQTVGARIARHLDGRLAEIDRGRESGDRPGVRHLQAVQRLGRIGDLVPDAEIVVQIAGELV